MDEQESQINDVSQLPHDFMKMPPPYWRSSSAIFHLHHSLFDVLQLLVRYIQLDCEIKNPEKKAAELNLHDDLYRVGIQFSEVKDPVVCDFLIRDKSEIISLMSAIVAEDLLNCVAVFNLHKDIAESIERLSPLEKLLVISASLSNHHVKGSTVYEGLKKLMAWRNAFAHGHCVDRPVKSLRHNHLVEPVLQRTLPIVLNDALSHTETVVALYRHLRTISINPYTAAESEDFEDLDSSTAILRQFVFIDSSVNASVKFMGKV